MAQGRFAKYRRAREEAIRQMLVEERIAALEMALALAEAQLARPEVERAGALEEQRKGIEAALARARRKKASST